MEILSDEQIYKALGYEDTRYFDERFRTAAQAQYNHMVKNGWVKWDRAELEELLVCVKKESHRRYGSVEKESPLYKKITDSLYSALKEDNHD